MRGGLMRGDCLDVMAKMASGIFDLVYLDPPFNTGRTFKGKTGEGFADKHGGMQNYLDEMRARVEHMHRLLKNTGSFYLHCDPTASHCVRVMLDKVFGRSNFRAQITWKRSAAHSDRMFGSVSDYILYYSKGDRFTSNIEDIIMPFTPEEIAKKFTKSDKRGRYKFGISNLIGATINKGESCEAWEGYNPKNDNCHWSVPKTGRYAKYINEHIIEGYLKIKGVHDRLDALNKAGMIGWSPNGKPMLKVYAISNAGRVPTNIWTDISYVVRNRTGYPTEKPLPLLERIIKASSNPGDMVLDPFCGTGTTLVAAERLERNSFGIDINEQAIKIARDRIAREQIAQ